MLLFQKTSRIFKFCSLRINVIRCVRKQSTVQESGVKRGPIGRIPPCEPFAIPVKLEGSFRRIRDYKYKDSDVTKERKHSRRRRWRRRRRRQRHRVHEYTVIGNHLRQNQSPCWRSCETNGDTCAHLLHRLNWDSALPEAGVYSDSRFKIPSTQRWNTWKFIA